MLPLRGLRGGHLLFSSSAPADELDAVECGGQSEAVCFVRTVEGEAQTSMLLDLGGRDRTLTRLQEDPVSATLDRLLRIASEAARKEAGWGITTKKKKKTKGKGKKRQAAASAAAEDGADATGDLVNGSGSEGPDPAAGWTAELEAPDGTPVAVCPCPCPAHVAPTLRRA